MTTSSPHADEYEDVLRKKARLEIDTIKKSYSDELEKELARYRTLIADYEKKIQRFEESLLAAVKKRIIEVAIAVVSVVGAAVAAGMAWMTSNGYQAVLSLQQQVFAVQPQIKEALDSLDKTKRESESTNRDLQKLLASGKSDVTELLEDAKHLQKEASALRETMAIHVKSAAAPAPQK
jgi:hypothetical protein